MVLQLNMYEYFDSNLAILQEQLPFTITDCVLGYKWSEQCRMQVYVTKTDGERIPLITTLKLKIIDGYFLKGVHDLITYDHTVTPTVVYFNGKPSAYHLSGNWYADIS